MFQYLNPEYPWARNSLLAVLALITISVVDNFVDHMIVPAASAFFVPFVANVALNYLRIVRGDDGRRWHHYLIAFCVCPGLAIATTMGAVVCYHLGGCAPALAVLFVAAGLLVGAGIAFTELRRTKAEFAAPEEK